jgi:hypothetical protein
MVIWRWRWIVSVCRLGDRFLAGLVVVTQERGLNM